MLFSKLAEKYPVRIPLPHSPWYSSLSGWPPKSCWLTPRRDRGHFLVIIVRHRHSGEELLNVLHSPLPNRRHHHFSGQQIRKRETEKDSRFDPPRLLGFTSWKWRPSGDPRRLTLRYGIRKEHGTTRFAQISELRDEIRSADFHLYRDRKLTNELAGNLSGSSEKKGSRIIILTDIHGWHEHHCTSLCRPLSSLQRNTEFTYDVVIAFCFLCFESVRQCWVDVG